MAHVCIRSVGVGGVSDTRREQWSRSDFTAAASSSDWSGCAVSNRSTAHNCRHFQRDQPTTPNHTISNRAAPQSSAPHVFNLCWNLRRAKQHITMFHEEFKISTTIVICRWKEEGRSRKVHHRPTMASNQASCQTHTHTHQQPPLFLFPHCSRISTEGDLRIPMTYDNHPNPIPSNPQRFFNHLNRPWIDLCRPLITSNDLQWPPMTSNDPQCNELLISKKGGYMGAVSSRFFDLLNSIMSQLKRSVDIKWLFDHRCYIHPIINSSK